jgi:hypothetical protein
VRMCNNGSNWGCKKQNLFGRTIEIFFKHFYTLDSRAARQVIKKGITMAVLKLIKMGN